MEQKEKWNLVLFFSTLLMSGVLMIWLAVDKPTQAEIAVIAHAREQGVSVSAYPDSLVDLLEDNPETEDFVLNYPFREDAVTDLSGYDRSQGVPLFMQWDERWGYMEYGTGLVGVTGCGPVCLAMAGYYVTGDSRFYPGNVVRFALENGYYSAGNGSKWTLISEGGVALGLDVKELPLVEDKIAAYLQAGDPVIAAMGPGDFTASGHFIVLTDYEDGMLSVNDPNSYVNSGKQWDYDALEGQISNLWVIQAPAEE